MSNKSSFERYTDHIQSNGFTLDPWVDVIAVFESPNHFMIVEWANELETYQVVVYNKDDENYDGAPAFEGAELLDALEYVRNDSRS